MATKAKAKKVEEDVEELEEAEPATKSKSKKDDVIFGVADIAAHLTEKTGKKVTTRELRTLIRKMARDGSGRVDREVIPGNRTRYSWSGIKDPEVQAIIKAFDSGELEADKREKLAALKENKAKKKAEEAKSGKGKAAKGKKSKKAEPEDEDDELELDDDE
jgi:hypothetical protein